MTPSMSRNTPGQTMELAPGRVVVGNKRFSGCVQDWTPNGYGWIVPLEAVPHPAAKKRNGRIYVDKRDVPDCQPLEIGAHVEFVIYADVRGLGAMDVELATEEPCEEHAPEGVTDVPLLAGWEKIWSEEHGEFYYWHQATKASSWERPGVARVRQLDQAQAEDGSLPANWEKHYDDDNEDWYYWNSVTKESSWERPGASANGLDELPKESSKSSKIVSREDDQTRVKGRVTNWQTIYGWMVPIGHVGVAMKSLIDNHGGKIFLNWRDAPGIDIKVGTELEFEVYVDEKGLNAADIRPASQSKGDARHGAKGNARGGKKGAKGKGKGDSDPLASLEMQWAKQDKKLGITTAAPAKRKVDDVEPEQEEVSTDGPLMPGWEQHWSEEHNCYYYWHKATKQSAWERPSMPTESNEDYAPNLSGKNMSTPKMATPMTPLQSGAGGSAITPITAVPMKKFDQKAARQPTSAPPAQRNGQKYNHGNRPIVPVWQQQGKRARF